MALFVAHARRVGAPGKGFYLVKHYEVRLPFPTGVGVILPILAVFAGLFGFGDLGVQAFDRQSAANIRSELSGPGASIAVRTGLDLGLLQGDIREVVIHGSGFSTPGLPLFTEPSKPRDGILRRLSLDLRDFSLNGLHIESLRAAIPDCRFDLGLALSKRRILLTQSGVGTGSVSLRDRDLEPFVLAKFHDIKRVSIRFANGRIHVEGHGQFLIVDTDFTVDARLGIVDGCKLMLQDATILFDGQPTDESSRQALIQTMNPVVDLNADLHLFGAIALDSLSMDNGILIASGATRIPAREPLTADLVRNPPQRVVGRVHHQVPAFQEALSVSARVARRAAH